MNSEPGGLFRFRASPSRMIAGFVGPLLLGLGSGISISAGFGSFGFSVLLDGLYSTFQLPLWLSQVVLTMSLYVIAWVWGRIPLGMGTVPTLLLVGPAISLGATLTPDNLPFAGNLAAFAIGILLFAFGISCSAAAALGPDGVTALSLAAEKRHGLPVPRGTFLWDFIAIALGVGLGGNFGVATVIGLVASPLLIHVFLGFLRKYAVK